ncbi:MAG TPA: DeoR family transcriptional regulator [Succinivibrionaceae bacterium]|nr:DeoR/GlpR transcriptional regulator [Succinivibrio sp.]HAR80472.1 DeoR family transcriptional regulator [Succinivibrionaceae bacterium]
MIPAQRQQRIVSLLEERGGVISINDLVDLLGVSHMTIRRDLMLLEQEKMVDSVSGGVRLHNQLIHDPTLQMKENFATEEKNRIGKEAAKYVQDGQCIYLDEGTTSLALAHYITNRLDLTVVTNDFEILQYLMKESKAQLIHVGGFVSRKTNSSTGMFAAKTIKSLNMDYAFISCSSWDLRGLTTPDPGKVAVKEAALEASINKILICDSSKYSKVAAYRVAELSRIDEIITDKKVPANVKTSVINLGVKLTLV